MRKGLVSLLVLVLAAAPAICGGRGSMTGSFKIIVAAQPDAPVKITRAVVVDPERKSGAGLLLLGPDKTGGEIRYEVAFEAKEVGIVAVEVAVAALNAFDEPVGVKTMAFGFKKPLNVGFTKYEWQEGARVHDDAGAYSVRVLRVKFQDGRVWSPPPPAPAPAPPTTN